MTMPSPSKMVPSSSSTFRDSGVETDGAATEDLVDPVLARPSLVRQHGLLGRPRPGQDLLGERRPVVGKVLLLADQGDLPVEALRSQGLDGSPSGERGPDDEDGAVRRQFVPRTHDPNIAIHSSAERGRKT